MNVIQTFRPDNSIEIPWENSKGNDFTEPSRLLCYVLSFVKLSRFYNDVELYTTKRGRYILVDLLKLTFKNVKFLPEEYSIPGSSRFLDQFYACSLQSEPFVFVAENILLNMHLPPVKLSMARFSNYLNTNTGFAYMRSMALQKEFLTEKILASVNESIQHYSCINQDICGGSDVKFWKDYFPYMRNFLLRHPRLGSLSEENFQFLICTYLFGIFNQGSDSKFHFLFQDNYKTQSLKSAADLYWQYSDREYARIPTKILRFEHTFKYMLNCLKGLQANTFDMFVMHFNASNAQRTKTNAVGLHSSNFFALTLECFKRFDVNFKNIEGGKISDIRKTIHTSPNKELIWDVFRYEKTKHIFYKKHLTTADKFVMNPSLKYDGVKQFLDGQICTQSNAAVVTTSWDWRLGIAVEELARLKVFYNSTVDAGRFYTVLYFDHVLQATQELRIDFLDAMILKSSKSRIKVRHVIEKICKKFDSRQRLSQEDEIRSQITSRIANLVNSNIVNWMTE